MTAQIPETLRYEGENVPMCTEPLETYFEMGGEKPDFEKPSTALSRGYIGKWEIVQDRLYLIGLEAWLEDEREITLEAFFPGFPDRVFAHWFSGEIRLPRGKCLQYVHGGYGSIYEEDILLDVQKGVVVTRTVRRNGTAPPDAGRSGYRISAMTVFARKGRDEESSA
jgi:hypothetical protein